MTWQNAVYWLVLLGAGAAYWWFKYGRFGGGKKFYAHKLGLADGETIAEFWQAAYSIERSTASYAWEAVSGQGKRGAMLTVALTSWNRLAIGAMETSSKPFHFRQGEVFASGSRTKPKYTNFSGTHGFETATVVLLTTTAGHQLQLEVPRSCLARLQSWTLSTPATPVAASATPAPKAPARH